MFHVRARISRLLRFLHLKKADEATLYAKWQHRLFSLCAQDLEVMQAHCAQFVQNPLISVIMPVYNPPLGFLVQAIESVRTQIYPHWELCIADDASTDPQVHDTLREYAATDARIHVLFRTTNGHISAASNSALELASGEFIALLDHDDVLPEDALFWVAATLQSQPDALLLYSDEDKIDENRKPLNPYAKPEWDPYLFLGENFFSHLGIYQRELVKSIGGFREGFEGSQDYDLAARCVAQISEKQIVHIPRVLYHWRLHEGSTAVSLEAKPYAQSAALETMQEHLARIHIPAKAQTNTFIGVHQEIIFNDTVCLPKISIIVLAKNQHKRTKNCLETIIKTTKNIDCEILVLGINICDKANIECLSALTVHSPHDDNIKLLDYPDPCPLGKTHARGRNCAVNQAKGELVVFVESDLEMITPDWLRDLAGYALLPGIGAVGAKLLSPEKTVEHGGMILGLHGGAASAYEHLPEDSPGYYGNLHLLRRYSAVSGACLAVKRSTYLEVSGFDEDHFATAYGDVDFCLKLRARGYRNLWTPRALLVRHASDAPLSRDKAEQRKGRWNDLSQLKKRWPHAFAHDPAYNPNLTLTTADYGPARVPRIVLGARHWPRPFQASFLPPHATGLHVLVVLDTNSRGAAEALADTFQPLLAHPAVGSYTFVGPKQVVHASARATGWFNAILLAEPLYRNKTFRENIQPYWPCVTMLPENAVTPPAWFKRRAILHRTLVHACHVLVQNEEQLESIGGVLGLDIRGHATCITDPGQPDQTQVLVDILTQARLEQPLPACCLGLAR